MVTKLHAFVGVTVLAFLSASPLSAQVVVKVTNTHLCCQGCVDSVETALSKVEGVKHEANQAQRTISLTAENRAAAQKAIDALAAAGFHGKIDNADVKYRPIEAAKEKVARLEVTGAHNCCGACLKSIRDALKGVEGVKSDTAKPNVKDFVIEGDFVANSAIQALLNAGFYVQVKK